MTDPRARSTEYTVALRAFSASLSPDEVSRIVGLAPTYARAIGSTPSAQREHVWEFEPDAAPGDPRFAARVEALLQAVQPFAEGLRALGDRAELVLWCACLGREPEQTVELSKQAIAAMADLGISLSYSSYACTTD